MCRVGRETYYINPLSFAWKHMALAFALQVVALSLASFMWSWPWPCVASKDQDPPLLYT